MQIEFTIPETTAAQLIQKCEADNITVEEFCATAVLDKLFAAMYGDLNEKIAPPPNKPAAVSQTASVIDVDVKRVNVKEKEIPALKTNNEAIPTTAPVVKKTKTRPLKSK